MADPTPTADLIQRLRNMRVYAYDAALHIEAAPMLWPKPEPTTDGSGPNAVSRNGGSLRPGPTAWMDTTTRPTTHDGATTAACGR